MIECLLRLLLLLQVVKVMARKTGLRRKEECVFSPTCYSPGKLWCDDFLPGGFCNVDETYMLVIPSLLYYILKQTEYQSSTNYPFHGSHLSDWN